METDSLRILGVVLEAAILTIFATRVAINSAQRIILFGMLSGFFMYSGFSTTYIDVPAYLMASYFAFSIAVIIGFVTGKAVFINVGKVVGFKSEALFNRMDNRLFCGIFIASFILIKFVYLLYPTNRLYLIFDPPSANIATWFLSRFEGNDVVFRKLIGYIAISITPFYYIALYFIRRNIAGLICIMSIVRYLEYVDVAYISRGTIMCDLLIILIISWQEWPRWRPIFVITIFTMLPILLYLFDQYSIIRMGGVYQGGSIVDGALSLLTEETNFLSGAGVEVIESGHTVDLSRYLVWIVTLPIPEALKFGVKVPLINYEISSLVLGKMPGEKGYYVVLSSLLAESYYLFGPAFFWLHGVFCGFLAAFFARILEGAHYFRFLLIYVAVLFLFDLNRGGIGAALPIFINGFIVFGLFILMIPKPPMPIFPHRNKIQRYM